MTTLWSRDREIQEIARKVPDSSLQSIAYRLVAMTTLWSRDREIQEIARKVPDPLSMKAGSGNETNICYIQGT